MKGKMKKTDWKYLVDTLLFICITGIVFIGVLLGFVIAEGPTVIEREKYFLGLHRHQWGHIHLYLSLTFTLLVIIHLILSWSWIKGKARHLFKNKWSLALMLTVFVSISVPFLFWVFTPKNSPAYKGYGIKEGERTRPNRSLKERHAIPKDRIFQDEEIIKMPETKDKASLDKTNKIEHEEKLIRGQRAKDTSGILITGKMTLLEIEKKTGVPAKKIIDKLRLPSDIPLDETLGILRKKYFFTMQEVRDVVSSLVEESDK